MKLFCFAGSPKPLALHSDNQLFKELTKPCSLERRLGKREQILHNYALSLSVSLSGAFQAQHKIHNKTLSRSFQVFFSATHNNICIRTFCKVESICFLRPFTDGYVIS